MLSVHLDVEASVFSNVYCTVQEGHTVSCDIFTCDLHVSVHSIYMFCEGFHIPCSDFNPGVNRILESVARSSFCEDKQAFALTWAADTFNRSCSATVSANLLFLMPDSVAVMRSTPGICFGITAKFSSLVRTSLPGWVSCVVDVVISPRERNPNPDWNL